MRRLAPVLCSLVLSACRASAPAPPTPAAAADGLRITYLANEGVLLESSGVRVIIDGLHRPNDLGYAVLAERDREALETAVPPWEGIDLVLVSHMHRDHFHAEAVGSYLAKAPGARLVTSEEVAGLVESGFPDWPGIRDRVTPVAWSVGRKETREAGGAKVTFVGLSHGGGQVATVQNFGHIIEIGRWRVFHAGDAVPSVENFALSGLAEAKIDVALLPSWHLGSDEAWAVVKQHIAPRRIGVIHVAPHEADAVEASVRTRAPDAVVFRRQLDDRIEL
jgi:L-ascorbate metabolism protein UlaG (beta-lactamase superfamily)